MIFLIWLLFRIVFCPKERSGILGSAVEHVHSIELLNGKFFFFHNCRLSDSQLFWIEKRFEWLDLVVFCVSLVCLFYLLWQFFSCISTSDPRKHEKKMQNNSHFWSNQDGVMHKAKAVAHTHAQKDPQQNNGAILANNNWTNDSWSEYDLNVSVQILMNIKILILLTIATKRYNKQQNRNIQKK